MAMAPEEFTHWFNGMLEAYNLGIREAARKIGISHPTVSDISNGVQPSIGHCVLIAVAFNEPVSPILRLAGHLPPVSSKVASIEELDEIMASASEDKREEILRYARYIMQENKVTNPKIAET